MHGYWQDGKTFKNKLGGFRKATKSLLDLVFIDAPHLIPQSSKDSSAAEPVMKDGRGWWFSKGTSFSAQEYTEVCTGFDESVKAVEDACICLGPFDGIMGFSQGAAMAALILYLQSLGKINTTFKFGVLIAGFKSRSSLHNALHRHELVKIPTLHIVGETDAVIPKAQALEILPFFTSPKVICHPGGHFIPTSGPCKTDYMKFLREMALNRNCFS